MKELIDRNALLAEYDRVHIGEPGKARKLIEDAPSVMVWIPVTERMPEEGDRYLCRVKSFVFPGSFYQSILRYDKYGFQDSGVYEDGVTHWMPLPATPKEGRPCE